MASVATTKKASKWKEPFRIKSLPEEGELRADGSARRHVAIIIPHRQRTEDLLRFFQHFSSLDTHGDHFDIFVIEQHNAETFNRGILLNAGFLAARAEREYSRYIFHDVDHYPTQETFDYYAAFPKYNIHFVIPHLGYKYHYDSFIGGVLGMTARNFEAANGFPSIFFGWGGEDDAFRKRLEASGATLWRPTSGKFILADHIDGGDAGNAYNVDKRLTCQYDWKHWKSNGLNRTAKLRVRELELSEFFSLYPAFNDPLILARANQLGNTTHIHTRFFAAEFSKADFQIPRDVLQISAAKNTKTPKTGGRRTEKRGLPKSVVSRTAA
jgi:N-terminal region of glycosyl transferase group 7/N-terminal domain of galactosyltransferase